MQKEIQNSYIQIRPLDSAKLRSKLHKFSIFTQGCLVQIFTTRGVVVPPANNLFLSETSIRSFRHLKHKNPSIISEDIDRNRWLQKKSEEEEEQE